MCNQLGHICELSCHHKGNFCHEEYPSLPSILCILFCCFRPTDSTRKNYPNRLFFFDWLKNKGEIFWTERRFSKTEINDEDLICYAQYCTATKSNSYIWYSTFLTSFTLFNIPEKKFARWKAFGSKCRNFLNSEEFLENSREISLLDLDLEAFSFHFSFSKWGNGKQNSPFNSRKEWKHFRFHSFSREIVMSM